ncbi:MAG: hypothetical protein DME40_08210 [Verrucomicrobia bacterium]|nr:MAG: hypothetical protein DME40_08210 [Verrucomicrobiota bacterium]
MRQSCDGSAVRDCQSCGTIYLGALQSHAFPQLHSLLSFMGQFLPLFLQPAGLSAANETVHIIATRIESRILGNFSWR